MKAVVMAGGTGTRLRPITIERPKPMVDIVHKPAIGHILSLLKQYGIHEIIITVQYLAHVLQDYFGDGASLGLNIIYCVEENPLGTAGGVKNVASYLDDTFLVLMGDSLTDFNLQNILDFHHRHQGKATITLYRVPNPLDFGVIITNQDGRVTQILEKPSWGEVVSDTINTGLYVLEPEILDFIPENQFYDFSTQLYPTLLAKNIPMYGYVAKGYWCDIGNIASFRQTTADILEGRVGGISLGHHLGNHIWAGTDVEISQTASLSGPIYLGNAIRIKDNVTIQGPTVIHDYSIIEEGAHIERSIIWRNSYIGKGVQLRGAVILKHCSLKAKASVQEGAVIGDGSIVGEEAVIHPEVKIWAGKEIEPGATIKHNVIWGSQGRRGLFSRLGVSGMINVDFTPEFSAKLAAAFGSILPKGSMVMINRDPHRGTRMLKRAAISGLPSAGIQVFNLGVQPIPVARYFTRVSQAVAGIHVRLSPFNQMVANMRFIDGDGLNLNKETERKIEHIFFREDFRRVYMDEIGSINHASSVVETYIKGFFQAINVDVIQKATFNLVIDYASSPAATVLPTILSHLNGNVVALNANVDEAKMSISHDDFEASLERLRAISSALEANMAIRLDVGGETIFVVDDQGNNISGIDLCAAMTELVLAANPTKFIAISHNLPHIFEKLAARHKANIIRTKVDAQALMLASTNDDVVMASDGKGNFIFPDFQPAIDALITLAKLLEFLATQNRSLSSVIQNLPPYYLKQTQVYCLWKAKGRVMRQLSQKFGFQQTQIGEGIKLTFAENEWILILPGPDHPHIEIIAEAKSQTEADYLLAKYARLVRELQEQGAE